MQELFEYVEYSERSDSVCVCVSWILLTWIEKRHPPRDTNSDRMELGALSHSLLTYRPPPNHGVCASTSLENLV
jgi:hypothetical protein